MNKKREKGFIALTSVLIIGAIVLILGIALFHSALTDYSISTAYESGQQAAFLADFCLKEGVLKLKENIDYRGGEEIEVNGMICYINPVEDIGNNKNTKKVSSLGRAGDQPHFSRSFQLVRYIVESSADDWNRGELENLEIVGDSLKLKPSEEIIIILNSATGKSCKRQCQQERTGYQCLSIGTDPAASDGKIWTAFQKDEEYSCLKEEASCQSPILDYSQFLSDCHGYTPAWTYCRCEQGKAEGQRISPEFDISGPERVKDSRIFWQANERDDGTIKVKVNVFVEGKWIYDQEVINGGRIPGLEPGTNLTGAKIQTKISFVGGPRFYPSLDNIKIFIELE